jgi:serine/threonine protein kinase
MGLCQGKIIPLDTKTGLMSPESQLEEAVCLAAVSLPDPAVRRLFLDQACAGNARLRAAVEEFLLAHADAEDFFAKGRSAVNIPEVDAQAAAAIKESNVEINRDNLTDGQIGSRVGRYKLLQKIGEGGCGTVYLAEQEEPVHRQVALKVIKPGMDTKNVIARFEAERQALALMDHPNIARVLDAGATDNGRPYFVMELVRGTRITKYCDENNLDTVQRLELFIRICHAIQHAHQKGIIHRDIKPSNILVTLHDGVPVPKVIDFGIAKATEGRLADNTMFTACDQFVGTPAYMSPEQAEISGLDVDTRSDIYSLGVLLYELLTGRTPFDSKTLMQLGLDEMRRTLREEEPQPPSTMISTLRRTELAVTARQHHAEPPELISQLKGDLDWIVMKALEKDRNRRYETADGLAMDIQRYLDNEPVVARPPSKLYRLQKLVHRNKIIFAAGGAVALALFIGLGMSTWLFLREREANRREARLRAEAEDRARITQAAMFVSQGKYNDANEILNGVKTFPANPTLDGVSAFRSVGEWLALQGRWKQAAERYLALIKIDKLDKPDVVAFDYQACSVVLAEDNDTETYEHFCQMAVTNYAMNPNVSILIACLVIPVNEQQIRALKPMADNLEHFFPYTPRVTQQWTLMPIGLWKYRCGDYDMAVEWCREGLAQRVKFPACDADLHIIVAMAYYQRGEIKGAVSELAEGRELVETKFKSELGHGRADLGYWFDWVFASLLLQEATALIDGNSTLPNTH